MDADECRRRARYFLTLAQQMSPREDRAAMIEIAAFWMKRAETEQNQRIAQQQTQPKKEPEGELS